MKTQVRSLASLSGLGIQHCHKLLYRLQMQLGSHDAVVVAQAGSYSSNLTLAWEPPCAMGAALKRQKKKKSAFHMTTHISLELLHIDI